MWICCYISVFYVFIFGLVWDALDFLFWCITDGMGWEGLYWLVLNTYVHECCIWLYTLYLLSLCFLLSFMFSCSDTLFFSCGACGAEVMDQISSLQLALKYHTGYSGVVRNNIYTSNIAS